MPRRTAQARRQMGRRWRWARRLFALILVAALAAIGYYLAGFMQSSEEFHLSTVRLEGLDVLTEEKVLGASGVSSGDSVMELNPAQIESAIETLPYVETAEVTLVFPDTMIVRVQERTPAATLIVRNAAYEVDRTCVVLRRYANGAPLMPPLVTNVGDVGVVEVGEVLESAALKEALAAWDAFRATRAASDLTLSEIAARSPDEILMFFDELPYEMRWGRGEVALQAERLDVLWQERGGQLECAEYLDLRFGADIVCK